MVLVVDDEAGIRDIISDHLSSLGIKVVQSNIPQDALELILNENIDCVITDVCMPGLNGIELIREVRKKKPAVKFIVISAMTDVLVAELNPLKVDLVLSKPFRLGSFEKQIQKVIHQK